MGFKTRPSVYRIEHAPTGRARCRRCRSLIPKGVLRVCTTAFVCPQRATCLMRCATCIDKPFAVAVLSVYKDASRVPCSTGVSNGDASAVRAAIQCAARGATTGGPATNS